jgi:drug/metabolite transporter (DMT)-like permease
VHAPASPKATLLGTGAILLWAALALLTAGSGRIPPFQLAAMTFAIGGGLGLASWIARPGGAAALRQPPAVWALGIGGLFGYHALYFAALRLAPPAEASLIAYLWPLLIVLFSALLPGERLRPAQVLGGILGLIGVTVLIGAREGGFSFEARYLPGYQLAFGCAFVWSGYSVLSRRFGRVPTDAVVGFCLATAALSFVCHAVFETTVWPAGPAQWLCVLGLGLGPVGAAFYLWDYGVKHGDITLLGVLSYFAPVLSTIFLVIAGVAAPSLSLLAACALIVAGAIAASWKGKRP